MICTSCATENEAGRRFCKECGMPLSAACANCGAPNTPDAKFCGDCGARLSDGAHSANAGPQALQAAPVAPPLPIAERRLVSVLFADLVGFTTLAEGRDAEDDPGAPDALLRPVPRRHRAVRRHGREVHRRRSHGRLGGAGRPRGRRRRSVRAALDLVDAVRSLGPGYLCPGRGADGRGRGHDGRHEPGHGRG